MEKQLTQHRPIVRSLKTLTWLLIGFAPFLLAGCNDESGVVGTGIVLRGTVSEPKQLASKEIEIRSQSGESASTSIDENGQYEIDSETIPGVGPWILRSEIGDDNYRYGIAYSSGIANVHSYTDVVLRRWFLEQHDVPELDTAFDSQEPMQIYPSRMQFADLADDFFAVMNLVLEDYELTGPQLLNSEFRADNTGIDKYLDSNPVFVTDRNVTFLKTRPVSETQRSRTQSSLTVDILLGAGSGQADTLPPSMPENLRALVSGTGEVVLVWEPSTNNTAVVGYDIVRNSEPLTVSPYPVYSDTGLQAGVAYTYEVRAIDIEGNLSSEATVTISASATAPESQAPSAPEDLETIESSTRRVVLTWTQNDFADVAGFDVYRGRAEGSLDFLVRVTSESVIDATVSSGQNYCYEVRSVNAAGTPSTEAPATCLTTAGVFIPPDETPLVDVPDNAGLVVRDTRNVACTDTFPSYNVAANVSVPAGCYLVENNILVDNFSILTLQPGVILKFAKDTELRVNPNGVLSSIGTVDSPVIMTGVRQSAGWWAGVTVEKSMSDDNFISHTVIEYTGSNSSGAAITLISSTNDPARLSVENSLIRHGQWYGISIPGDDSQLVSFRGNLIEKNARAALVHHKALETINDGSEFSKNALNRVYVALSNFGTNIEINNPGLPIEIGGIRQSSESITIINEGVKMFFIGGSAFMVRGELAIRGTAANPVVLTSKTPGAGAWVGMQVIEGATAELQHAVIENAGKVNEINSEGAALFADDATLSLENVTLRRSGSYGFHATGTQVKVISSDPVNNDRNARDDVVDPGNL